MDTLLEKLKEKKAAVVTAVQDALNSVAGLVALDKVVIACLVKCAYVIDISNSFTKYSLQQIHLLNLTNKMSEDIVGALNNKNPDIKQQTATVCLPFGR